jgi:hypothetical protein
MTIVLKAACAAAALTATLTLGDAHAHHSYAAFDRCTPVALEGEIDSIEWVNPHIRIHLRTENVSSYFVEWFSLIQLQQAGLEAEVLKPGDRIRVTGNPMRDPNMKVLSLLSEIRRPTDGWSWLRTTPLQRPADCATN